MGSEERDRIRKLGEQAAEAKRKAREAEVAGRLAEEAAIEKLDSQTLDELSTMLERDLGASIEDIRAAALNSDLPASVRRDAERAYKAGKDGWIFKGDKKKAAKIVNSNPQLKKALNKKGCRLMALTLIAFAGGVATLIGWGAVEVVQAVL